MSRGKTRVCGESALRLSSYNQLKVRIVTLRLAVAIAVREGIMRIVDGTVRAKSMWRINNKTSIIAKFGVLPLKDRKSVV